MRVWVPSAVGCPSAPVVIQRIAGDRRSPHPPYPRSSDRRLRRTCSRPPFRYRLQQDFKYCASAFSAVKSVCRHLAVFAAADRADSLVRCRSPCRRGNSRFPYGWCHAYRFGCGSFHRCSASKRPSRGPAHCRRQKVASSAVPSELRPQTAQDL